MKIEIICDKEIKSLNVEFVDGSVHSTSSNSYSSNKSTNTSGAVDYESRYMNLETNEYGDSAEAASASDVVIPDNSDRDAKIVSTMNEVF